MSGGEMAVIDLTVAYINYSPITLADTHPLIWHWSEESLRTLYMFVFFLCLFA